MIDLIWQFNNYCWFNFQYQDNHRLSQVALSHAAAVSQPLQPKGLSPASCRSQASVPEEQRKQNAGSQ